MQMPSPADLALNADGRNLKRTTSMHQVMLPWQLSMSALLRICVRSSWTTLP